MPGERLALWRRFHVRLTLVYGVAVFAVLGGLAALSYHHLAAESQLALRERLVALASATAAGVAPERLDEPAYGAELSARLAGVAGPLRDIQSAWCLRRAPDGAYTFVADYTRGAPSTPFAAPYDASGVPLLQTGLDAPIAEREPVRDAFGVTLSGYAPVHDANGLVAAVVGFDVDATAVDTLRARVLWVTLTAAIGAAGLLAAAAAIAGRMLRRPLWRVIDATAEIARGHLAARVGLERADEFGVLGRNFDAMAQGLEEREFLRATFGRYVSDDVARRLLADRSAAGLGGEERVVTVLFSDLAGYSTVSERLAPPEVVRMLNEYMGAMTEVIAAHEGCVIEFLGDAILAVFGAPAAMPDHAARALGCARAMREALAALNRRWRAHGASARWLGDADLAARIGVHTGPVVAGNMGGELRMKYAVIGDTVNVAARLEQLNKALGTTILASAETVGSAAVVGARPLGRHSVKGRAGSVEVFAL